MDKYFLFVFTALIFSCGQPSNIEIVEAYKKLEVSGSSAELAALLSDQALVTLSDGQKTMSKEDILLNHEFQQSFEPWIQIKSIWELNDSTVVVHDLETNKMLTIFEIDTVGYQYNYTLNNSLITQIKMDTIANSGYAYRTVDSLYRSHLVELFDWISLIYPEKFEQFNELNSTSAELLLELAKEKRETGY